MHVRSYEASDEEAWDKFCQGSFQANLLHTRKFLSYHQDRFHDASLVIENEQGKWIGIMPAARHPEKKMMVVSHPGITYGGILHQTALQGGKMVEAIRAISQFYLKLNYAILLYKPIPVMYHRIPAQDDLYALFILKANRIRCDLSCSVDLERRATSSTRRIRSLKKANKHGVKIEQGPYLLSAFWHMLTENLRSKHGVEPVHTLNELRVLAERFPDEISCVCGMHDGEVVAGVLTFYSINVCHAQYIASSENGRKVCALDAVMDYLFGFSINKGIRWFDFGTSNESNGGSLNEGLYKFKSEFGGGGMVHEFFELPLQDFNIKPII